MSIAVETIMKDNKTNFKWVVINETLFKTEK